MRVSWGVASIHAVLVSIALCTALRAPSATLRVDDDDGEVAGLSCAGVQNEALAALCALEAPRSEPVSSPVNVTLNVSAVAHEEGGPAGSRPPPRWAPNWQAWYRNPGNVQRAMPAQGLGQPGQLFTSVVHKHPDHRPFAMCTIPRNGCSRWRRLLRRIEGYPDYLEKDPHSRFTNGLKYVDQLQPPAERRVWATAAYFKVFIARNPLERALSAYLSKKDKHNLPATFAGLVATFGKPRRWPAIDAHWRPQVTLCHSPALYHYDFIARVEDRNVWMPALFAHLRIGKYVQTGWADPAAGIQSNASFAGASDVVGSVTTDATRLKALRHHFTPAVFRRAMCYYREDIVVLNYNADVQRLWRELYPNKPPPLLNGCP